jgi:hypothetical protein
MQIVKGKVSAPIKAVCYGPEGIGKTTFASQWPAPLFVDCEGGTLRLAVDRVDPGSFSAVEQVVTKLASGGDYKTLVFDTADWLEKMMIDHVCAKANQASIEGFGYGKGYTHLAECWRVFLDKVARMQQSTGMHVVFLAHAAMRKQELPDEAGAFDRWELKLLKQSPGVLKEWADLVLLLNYKTMVVDHDGKKKAEGGRRVMYATHHACWDAKNRFGLPDEMPMEFKAIAGIFDTTAPKAPPPPVKPADDVPSDLKPAATVAAPANPTASSAVAPTPTEVAPVAPPTATTAQVPDDPDKAPLLVQLSELMKASNITKEDLGAELARKGVVPANMSPREYNTATLKRIVGNWAAVSHNINLQKQKKAA